MYSIYRTFTRFASPLIPLLLKLRLKRGKEDAARLPERLGKSTLLRPAGKLLWIHAASVGEANAVVPLIENLLRELPKLHIILTTVTVTSAALMVKRLPARARHQFVPVDTLKAVRAFLGNWKPDIALWVDSEFWPNLIVETQKTGAVMGIVNARMSERSYKRWQLLPGFIRRLLSGFSLCFAQSPQDAERLIALGLPRVTGVGNLKYDTPPPAFDMEELTRLHHQADSRPVLVAASTHRGEEAMLAEVHRKLTNRGLKPLTIIVPRHANRGDAIMGELSHMRVARRSRGEAIARDTEIYLADTMGELGLFYMLADLVFIGGSLVRHGGQSPLEAAKFGCAIVAGPHMENFAGLMDAMLEEKAIIEVPDAHGLAQQAARLLPNEPARADLGQRAEAHVERHAGALAAITQELRRYLA